MPELRWAQARGREIWLADAEVPAGRVCASITKNGFLVVATAEVAERLERGYCARVCLWLTAGAPATVEADDFTMRFAGDTPEEAMACCQRWADEIAARWADWPAPAGEGA